MLYFLLSLGYFLYTERGIVLFIISLSVYTIFLQIFLSNFNFRIMPPVVLNYKIRNKQVTIEHNFITYSNSYMFRPHGVTIRLNFRTY